jgi:hypothetical protein
MAHFAHIEDGVVTTVIVVSDLDALDPFPESEPLGQAFIASLGLDGMWKQTSYHGNFRGNYAGIGYTFDEQRDAFIPPKPYSSWTLNESTCLWEPPVPYPTEGEHMWDEDSQTWVETSKL